MASLSQRRQEVQRSLELLRMLNQSTDDYLFLIDLDTQLSYFANEEIMQKFNLPTITDGAPIDFWQQVVYPRDYPAVAQDLGRVLSGAQDDHNLVYRLVDRSGKRVWINCRGKVVRDSDGERLMFVGRVSDTVLGQKTDPLTGLLNEYKYLEDVAEALKDGAQGMLMIFGLDDFKNINIRFGRQYGDQILQEFAKTLEKVVPPQFLLYRLEGDRFALNLSGYDGEAARQLYQQLCQSFVADCTISAGAVRYGEDDANANTLFQYGESSLDRAKYLGKNMLVCFSSDFYEENSSDIELLMEMRQSVQQDCSNFFLCYQPQMDAIGCSITGMEALLRYNSPRRGAVGPDEFIPLLEKSGLISPVGEWVLRTALEQCCQWRKHLPQLQVSVNISYVQFKQEEFAHKVAEIFMASGLPAGALTLEVTESMHLQDFQYFNRIFRIWEKAGIEIAIDDFGTGYSSLSYLKSLDINQVKIDRCFVRGIQHSSYNYQLLKNIIELTQDIQIRVCCEGVETEDELEVLQELAPDSLQGFLFDAPLTKKCFENAYIHSETPAHQSREKCRQRYYEIGQHAAERLLQQNADRGDLSVITEDMDELVYVVDPETYDIHYMNAACRQLTGMFNYKGRKCYEVMYGRTSPCENCTPSSRLNRESFKLTESYNGHLKRHFLTKTKIISWQQKDARLGIDIDVTEKEMVSQSVQKKLDFEKNIVSCSRILAEETDGERALARVLGFIGEYYQADRAYIFEPDFGGQSWSNSYEWCASGAIPQKDALQNVPVRLMARWIDAFERDDSIYIDNLDNLKDSYPEEWGALSQQGIHSVVAIPILRRGKLIGYIGADNPRAYSHDDGQLRAIACFLAERLARNATETRIGELEECNYADILNLTQLGLWSIVLHENGQNHEMFANDTMRQLLGARDNTSPRELYRIWHDGVNPDFQHYVESSVMNMIQSVHITQLEYLWNHPVHGDVVIRCVGARIQDRDGRVCLQGYHRMINNIDRPQMLPEQTDWMKLEYHPDSGVAHIRFGHNLLNTDADEIQNFPLCWVDSQYVHPDYAAAFAEFFIGEGGPSDCSGFDLLLKGRNGVYEWFRMRTTYIKDGSGSVKVLLESLNQMRKWELEYNRKSDFYQAVLAETIAYAEFDMDLGITLDAGGLWADLADASRRWNEPLFAYTQRELGKNIAPEDLAWSKDFFTQENFLSLPKENHYAERREYRRKVNGEYRWVQVAAHVFKERFNDKAYALMLLKDIDAQKRQEMALQAAARLDPLTQVFNGKAFEQEVFQYMRKSNKSNGALLMFDMDNFKAINDNYGHLEGDNALQRMVDAMRASFPGNAIFGRLGGDEFLAFTPDCTDEARLERILGRLFDRLHAEEGIPISCSAGIVLVQAESFAYETSLHRADLALYHSKQLGKNRFSFHHHMQG